MRYDPDIHHRRSTRLRGFDYAAAGAYFVTFCVQGRECLFGGIADGVMALNEAGRMVEEMWRALPERFPHVATDEFVVMPNHFHGIVVLNGRGESCIRPKDQGDHKDRPYGTVDGSVGGGSCRHSNR